LLELNVGRVSDRVTHHLFYAIDALRCINASYI